MTPSVISKISSRPTVAIMAALLALPLLAPAATRSQQGTTEEGLRAALSREVRRAAHVSRRLGVVVYRLDDGQEVYSHHGDRLLIPASNVKLFTTAAALEELGPGYFFTTRVYQRGPIIAGVLHGDLAVVGGGDPTISGREYYGDSFAVFHQWAKHLESEGVREIGGDVHLVTGFFEPRMVHPDWPVDQRAHWYEAPISSLALDDNCFLVRVEPGARPGARGWVEIKPRIPGFFRVTNRVRTSRSRWAQRINIVRPAVGRDVEVSGRLWVGAPPSDQWVAVNDPIAYFGAGLREALHEEGIGIKGRMRAVRRLEGAEWKLLAVHRTDLVTVIDVTNKHSQNFFAECTLKTLGAERCSEGSWRGGLRAIAEFLLRIGIRPGSYHQADGSGMSRNNRFSPNQVATLLRFMYFHRYGRVFMRSLPYGGEADLHWRERLADPPYRGNVLAKTGTLDGVSALSGYAKARSGTLYVFSIIGNRTRANYLEKDAEDAIVRGLIDHG